MNERKKLLMRISTSQFAAWELHMFLDTHPCDKSANEMFRKYTAEYKMLKKEYEAKYGPLVVSSSDNADWLNDPWPWENERSCD